VLVDTFGRVATDLRVSLTDRCNLRCTYCMPPEGVTARGHGEILSYEELAAFTRVAAEVADGNILDLVERFLAAGVMEDGVFMPTSIGTPQGGVISPLLANIVLNQLDWQLQAAGFRHVRYADDFVVLCQNDQQAQEALNLVTKVLESELGLQLSPEKRRSSLMGRGTTSWGFDSRPAQGACVTSPCLNLRRKSRR